MTTYSNQNEDFGLPPLHLLIKDPAFWKGLKHGDVVNGREVMHTAQEMACGWPMMHDLMSDEGRGWMVCRAGFDHPDCGCPHEEVGA